MKREQFYGCNFHYTRHTLSYFIDSMNRFDIHKIEFYAASPHMYVDDYTPGEAREIRRKLDRGNLEVMIITAEQCLYPISMATEDPFARERSMRYYERALEQGYELGAKALQIMGGFATYEEMEENNYHDLVMDGLYRVCKHAEKLGMKVILESDCTSTVRDGAAIKATIKELGLPNLTGMIDFGASWDVEDFEETVKLLGDDLYHVHVNDVKDGAHCKIIGTGDIPIKEWFATLDKYGYKGGLTPELWGFQYINCADEAFEQGLRFFESYLQETGQMN